VKNFSRGCQVFERFGGGDRLVASVPRARRLGVCVRRKLLWLRSCVIDGGAVGGAGRLVLAFARRGHAGARVVRGGLLLRIVKLGRSM
jgi:hypothetical protein